MCLLGFLDVPCFPFNLQSGSSFPYLSVNVANQASRESQDLAHKSNLRRGFLYDQVIPIYHSVRSNLLWWIEQVNAFNGRPLQIPSWDRTIEADASMVGWGAYCQGQRTGGPWTAQEQWHLNFLELAATFLALQSFCSASKFLPGGESFPTPFRPIQPDLGVGTSLFMQSTYQECRTS